MVVMVTDPQPRLLLRSASLPPASRVARTRAMFESMVEFPNFDIDTFGNMLLIWFKSMVRKYPFGKVAGYVAVVDFYKEEATLANLL